jgi:hypothetical protein
MQVFKGPNSELDGGCTYLCIDQNWFFEIIDTTQPIKSVDLYQLDG